MLKKEGTPMSSSRVNMPLSTLSTIQKCNACSKDSQHHEKNPKASSLTPVTLKRKTCSLLLKPEIVKAINSHSQAHLITQTKTEPTYCIWSREGWYQPIQRVRVPFQLEYSKKCFPMQPVLPDRRNA